MSLRRCKCNCVIVPDKIRHERVPCINFFFHKITSNDIIRKTYEPRREKTGFRGFRPGATQKQARCLKFWLQLKEELYLPSSENKGAGQFCSYCTADLRLCFRICKNLIFSLCGSFFLGTRSRMYRISYKTLL